MRKLIAKFGSPIDALKATRGDLLSLDRVGEKIADAFIKGRDSVDLDSVKRKLKAFNADYICIDDERYPRSLRNLYDAPIGLYVIGDVDLNMPSVAVVGCRNCSVYGQIIARKFAYGLGRAGLCVVSGMARGIDTYAHRGALEAEAKTVAVLGCGIDIVYPPENVDIYKSIISKGAIISEYPFGMRADRSTFPMRNRIIAGMSMATLLVESDVRGGGMITARLACDMGKDVFAIPGRIDQSTSAGCNQIIREGAHLATSVADIIEELGFSGQLEFENIVQSETKKVDAKPVELEGDEALVYSALSAGDTLVADEIAIKTKLPVQKVMANLLILELKHFVQKRLDGKFEKTF